MQEDRESKDVRGVDINIYIYIYIYEVFAPRGSLLGKIVLC